MSWMTQIRHKSYGGKKLYFVKLYFCLIASLSEYVSVYCLVDIESGNLP